MSPVEDTLDGIVLRWPKPAAPQSTARTLRQRLDWLAFPLWLVRLAVECLGWVALVALITRF